MKQKHKTKIIFWTVTVVLFTLNIIGIIVFKKHIRLSLNSLIAPFIFIVMLLRGVLAYSGKNDQYLILRKYVSNRFYKYNRPTKEQLKDFYIKATIYFAVLPFYLPLAVFSSKNEHTLWCLFLLFVSHFAIIGIEVRKMMLEAKEAKIRETVLEKEKEEQEKREELGHWK